ncbi:MAG: toll/interleukin-1 receptor domain-containing protein, partial [Gammaproteobacteria bacterium]
AASGVQVEAISQQLIVVLQEKANKTSLCEAAANGLGRIAASGHQAEAISEQLMAVLQEKENDARLRRAAAWRLGDIAVAGVQAETINQQLMAVWQDEKNDLYLQKTAADGLVRIAVSGVQAEAISQQLIAVLQEKENDYVLREDAAIGLGDIAVSSVQTEAISQQLMAVLQEKENAADLRKAAAKGLGLIAASGIQTEAISQQLIAALQEDRYDTDLRQAAAGGLQQVIAADVNLTFACKILALLWQNSSISVWSSSYQLTEEGRGYLIHCLVASTQHCIQSGLDNTQRVACLAEVFYQIWNKIDSLILHVNRPDAGSVICQLSMIVAGKIWFPNWLSLTPETAALLLDSLQHAAAKIDSKDTEQANIQLAIEQLANLTNPLVQPTFSRSAGEIVMTSSPFWYSKGNTDLLSQYKQLKAFLSDKVKSYLTTNFPNKHCIAISYACGIPEHEKGVERLARFLEAAGMEVLLDKWADKGNADIGAFIEKMFTKAHRLLVIGTPLYLTKYNKVKENQEQAENQLLTLMQAMTPTASEHVLRFEARILLRLCIAGESISNRIYPLIWSGQR